MSNIIVLEKDNILSLNVEMTTAHSGGIAGRTETNISLELKKEPPEFSGWQMQMLQHLQNKNNGATYKKDIVTDLFFIEGAWPTSTEREPMQVNYALVCDNVKAYNSDDKIMIIKDDDSYIFKADKELWILEENGVTVSAEKIRIMDLEDARKIWRGLIHYDYLLREHHIF